MSAEVILQLQVSLQKFIDHVDSKLSEEDDAGNGLEKQFRELRDLTVKQRDENTIPATEGRKPYNMKKNRYKDILPFDSTRVLLMEIPDEPGSDYINANFIEGLDIACHYYIASQGPLPNTVNDFWRMLLENDVRVIFMACKLEELGKKKCEHYWPDEVGSTKLFGEIEVTLLNEEKRSEHYTIRNLEANYNGKTLTLIQLHYTGWPDHDIPDDIEIILEMIAEMRKIRKDHEPVANKRPPAVIHCSAGCGRTGTICAIDYAWDILQTGKLTPDFDLYEIIKHMREQRQSMIQTPDQYEMVFKATQQLFKEHLDMIQDHDYGNFKFPRSSQDLSSDDGDIEIDPQITGGEARRKHSIVPEIQEALYSYGIKTEISNPAEEIPQSSVKATKALFEAPLSPVLKTENRFEPKKVKENFQGHAADSSTQHGKDHLVQHQGSIFDYENTQKQEILQPELISQEPIASHSYVNKPNHSLSSSEKKFVTKITVSNSGQTQKTKQNPSAAVEKPRDKLKSKESYSYAYNQEEELDTKETDGYAYASVAGDRSQGTDMIGLSEKNFYSSVKKTHNGATLLAATDLYTPVQKAHQSKKPPVKHGNEDDPYETVQIGSGEQDDAPSIPHRGYMDEPSKSVARNSSTEKTTGMSTGDNSSSEFGKRLEKKFKGPRPPPAEWTKGKH